MLKINIFNYYYFGTTFGLSSLKGSIYFNGIILTFADIVGYFFTVWTSKFRRKSVFWITNILVALTGIGFFTFPDNEEV